MDGQGRDAGVLEPFGQFHRWFVRETAEHDMAHLLALATNRLDDRRMVVSVRHAPPAGNGVNQPPPVGKLDFHALAPLIEAAAAVKRKIVEQDPFEENIRRYLNLGHTYAHAIEWYQHTHDVADPMTHGEAVAVGMVQAALLSERLGVCKPGLADQLRADLQACGLPTELPCPESELEAALWKDKKAEKGILHFVLIKKIGKVIIKDLDDLHQPAE